MKSLPAVVLADTLPPALVLQVAVAQVASCKEILH
jgi:hypothetical protein